MRKIHTLHVNWLNRHIPSPESWMAVLAVYIYRSTNILVCSTIYYSAKYNLVKPAHTQPRELTGSASSIFIYTCHKTFLLYYRCINPSGTRQPQSTANGTMAIHLFAFYIRAGSARPHIQTTIRSPQAIRSDPPLAWRSARSVRIKTCSIVWVAYQWIAKPT